MHSFNSRRFAAPLILILAACTASDSKRETSAADASAPIWTLSTKSDEARQYVEAGERAVDQGRFNKAYEQFKRSVAADSAFAYGYLRTAQNATSLDEYNVNLRRAVAYESTANETEKMLIDIEQKLFARDVQGALDIAKQLTQKQPSNPRSWWTLATVQWFNAGDVTGARESLRKAVDLAPQYGFSHLILGQALTIAPMQLADAEKEVDAGDKLWPNQPLSYDFLGDLRRAQGRVDEAVQAYSRQIELDPQESEGYNQRGHANTFSGKYDQARADYDAAIRLSKNNAASGNARSRAYVSAYAGDFDASLKELNDVYEAIDGMKIPDPQGEKVGTLESEIIIATHTGRIPVAEKAYSLLVPLSMQAVQRVGTPEFKRGVDENLAFEKARIAIFKGDFATAEKSIADLNKLLEQDRGPNKLQRLHRLRGWLAFQRKQYAQAVSEFEQDDPQNIIARYYRARALQELGRTAEAKAMFKEVAIYNFDNAPYAAIRNDAIARAG